MKIATWNVNGIRARQAQVQEWMDAERPDVVCLQEIKASPDQLPVWLCELEGYWCYWHGGKGYSGVGLHISKTFSPERPAFEHPAFDYENRIVVAYADHAGGIFAGLSVVAGFEGAVLGASGADPELLIVDVPDPEASDPGRPTVGAGALYLQDRRPEVYAGWR